VLFVTGRPSTARWAWRGASGIPPTASR